MYNSENRGNRFDRISCLHLERLHCWIARLCWHSHSQTELGDISENTSNLADTFQDKSIHDRWESVYRGNSLQDRFNDRMLDALIPQCGLSEGNVLDAGCGIGEHTIRFAERGFRCVGVDVSDTVLELAGHSIMNTPNGQVEFVHGSLETLDLHRAFDLIHCRGVLMHIPRWRIALTQLCRHLAPGGTIMIWENNHRSIEMKIARAMRLFRKPSRRRVVTPDGIEFHDQKPGYAPLTRVANLGSMERELDRLGIDVVVRRTSEFFDINRFPIGIARNMSIRFNRIAFRFPITRDLACGNVIIGRRRE
jgi:2-polyprenyl-3-methyl-5-hydroxy-6-metoxy-1,4-benzoquinol methylase